ncbi:YceI family protein [Helicobacter turcicus]|uniref:YceI family protein n=1 Tax=Helicobacter turcicus TaxID=2867412 RepID=A0ABS7JM97_9HELI|nr:YceI family protein [Helicobacter turcicus]MBX7490515.1 YceI family protein [Helicobacter turcicus]MBX7545374.1 YceI family protein [Helicobacter turcicus]
MKKFLLVSSLVAALSFPALAAPYAIDVTNSKVGFSVKHIKITKVDGVFKNFSANIDYDTATKSFKTLEGEIDMTSVDTQNEKRDAHLQASDMFDAQKFPKMFFKMTKYEAGKIYGDLTIKDVTKPVVLTSKETLKGNALEVSAQARIKRSEFGLEWGSVFKDNAVSDEVDISLNLKANAQ